VKTDKDQSSKGMAFIFITLLIDVIGFGLIIPITPRLVQSLSHLSVSQAAVPYAELSTLYGLMQFIFAPVLGSLSDRYGRRPVLLASLFCNGVDMAFMALAPALWWLFIGRTISGIAGASFTAASAYIADISPPEKRAQNFGMIGAAFGIGFVVGPMLGGILGNYGLRLPFWAGCALCIGNCLYGYFFVPESLAPENRRPFAWKEANTLGSLKLFSLQRSTMYLGAMLFVSSLAQQFLQNTWILYTQFRLGWTPLQNGIGLGLVGLCIGGVQAGLSRVIVPKFGEANCLIGGLLITTVGFVLYGFAFASWIMYGTIVIWSLGAISGPAGQSIVSNSFGQNRQGAVQGAVMSIQSICMVIGPILGGAIFSFSTSAKLAHPVPGATFFVAAVLSAVAALLSVATIRTRNKAVFPDPEQQVAGDGLQLL
jgi:DHA1 family tetracycline resistance protein-like MFS transporter